MTTGDVQKPSGYDLAAPVASRVEVQAVNLVESLVRRARDSGFPRDVESAFMVRTEVDPESHVVMVFPRFRVATKDGKGKKLPSFIVEAEFQLIYSINDLADLEDANFQAFGALNGIFNCWAYWREYVQQVTVRMGLPPLVLPVYRPDRPFSGTRNAKKIASSKKSKALAAKSASKKKQ